MTSTAGEDQTVSRHRDVKASRDAMKRSVELALAFAPAPSRVLDVGCGTGALLRELGGRLPDALELTGIDEMAAEIQTARRRGRTSRGSGAGPSGRQAAGPRLSYFNGVAERLPFEDSSFDLVISALSFGRWGDQATGLTECRRVLEAGGLLVLTDLFSLAMLPATWLGQRDRSRTPLQATRMLAAAGFRSIAWHRHSALLVRSVTARAGQ